MKILLIDNRDSFTFNLADACRAAGAEVRVVRNSIGAVGAMDIARAAGGSIMLSPGPGAPVDAGCCLELVRLAEGVMPVVGICLGHQVIVEAAGGLVSRASKPSHGKSSTLAHAGAGPFAGLPSPIRIGRYHSLCTPIASLPERFAVDAELEGMAMAIRDDASMQLGLQFHPESILTPLGDRLIEGVLNWAQQRRDALPSVPRWRGWESKIAIASR